jgi:cytochrome bd-type quinol oxidase subunit 2
MATIAKYKAQKRLTTVWFCATGLLLTYVILWMITGKEQVSDITTWLIQYIGPYLTLITTGFIVVNQSDNRDNAQTDVFFYRLSLFVSIFYIGFLLVILILIPKNQFEHGNQYAKEAFEQTSKILPYFETILGGILGIFFTKKSE